MARALSSRTRFVLTKKQRRGERVKYPYLKQKLLQLQLWTAAYMLDSWEAVVLLVVLPGLLCALAYYALAMQQ